MGRLNVQRDIQIAPTRVSKLYARTRKVPLVLPRLGSQVRMSIPAPIDFSVVAQRYGSRGLAHILAAFYHAIVRRREGTDSRQMEAMPRSPGYLRFSVN
jgi:hypothetical protein